jgi:hypothetical protein
MIKKVMLVASLAIVAAVVAPVASASAATLAGTCTIEGTATFPEKLPPNGKLAEREYKFKDEAKGSCHGTISGGLTIEENIKEATVEGKGELACLVAENEATLAGKTIGGGTGKVILNSGTEFQFNEFKFAAAAGDVNFTGKPVGAEGGFGGSAEFGTNTNQKVLEQCLKGEPEIESLKFTALAAGVI